MKSKACTTLLRGTGGILLGLFCTTATVGESGLEPPDPRVAKLKAFFDSYSCPEPNHAEEYVRAADDYGIDFRILPAISLVESTCGSYQRRNNHWGWNSARTGFDTVVHGIRYVSRQLAQGERYRDHDLRGKLWTYNPRPHYVAAVQRLMRQIEAQ